MIIQVDLLKSKLVQFGWNDEYDKKLLKLAGNAKFTEKAFSHFPSHKKLFEDIEVWEHLTNLFNYALNPLGYAYGSGRNNTKTVKEVGKRLYFIRTHYQAVSIFFGSFLHFH